MRLADQILNTSLQNINIVSGGILINMFYVQNVIKFLILLESLNYDQKTLLYSKF